MSNVRRSERLFTPKRRSSCFVASGSRVKPMHSVMRDFGLPKPCAIAFVARVGLRFEKGEIAFAFFDRMQVDAVEVLAERDLVRGLVVGRKHARRNAIDARELGGAQAALAGDDFVAVAVLHDEDRLQDAVLLDRVRERCDLGVVEMHADLKLGGVDLLDRDEVHEKGGEILQMRSEWCPRSCGRSSRAA